MAGGGRRISVAIASYNGAHYIVEQLASIAGQTLLPDEVILSDDGSRDDTVALAEQFATHAPFPLRIIRQTQQLGILRNFYAAFAECTGDTIAYCDQDDVWLPEKLARQVAALDAGAMLVVHPSRIVDDKLNPLGRQEPHNFARGALAAPVDATKVHAFGHQMLFRRPVLDAMQALQPIAQKQSPMGFSNSFDNFIPFCASLLGGITILDEPQILFRRHAGAISGAGSSEGKALTRQARAAIAIKRDLFEARERLATTLAAIDGDLVPTEPATKVAKALRRREKALTKLAGLAARRTRVARIMRLTSVVPALLTPTGFTNRRPLHDVAIALVAATAA